MIYMNRPLHSNILGSGFHSPSLVHKAVLGPECINPGGQEKVTLVPSKAGSIKPITVATESLINDERGCPHLPRVLGQERY